MKQIILDNFCNLIPVLLEKFGQDHIDEFWFRGQRDASWTLLPGAFRIDPEIEAQRLLRFKMYAPALIDNCPDLNDYKKWLPLMQHYGVPTRLLDWSISPLIALFFAVNNNIGDRDAALFMFEPGKWASVYHKVNFILAIESTDNQFIKILVENAFSSKRTNRFTFPLFSESNFQRSFIQQSVFTIHDSLTPMEDEDTENLITKFVIPKQKINEFKSILIGLGISEIAIFSDLDTLGKWTKKLKVIRK